jgi:hypothetical protein
MMKDASRGHKDTWLCRIHERGGAADEYSYVDIRSPLPLTLDFLEVGEHSILMFWFDL